MDDTEEIVEITILPEGVDCNEQNSHGHCNLNTSRDGKIVLGWSRARRCHLSGLEIFHTRKQKIHEQSNNNGRNNEFHLDLVIQKKE